MLGRQSVTSVAAFRHMTVVPVGLADPGLLSQRGCIQHGWLHKFRSAPAFRPLLLPLKTVDLLGLGGIQYSLVKGLVLPRSDSYARRVRFLGSVDGVMLT